MRSKKRSILMPLGIFLLAAGLCLAAALPVGMHLGAKKCQTVLTEMLERLPERWVGNAEDTLAPGMPALSLDGTDYVALLEVPEFGVTLPVAKTWDPRKLFVTPARFSGSVYDGSLVIGGADLPQQFFFCDQIGHGAAVLVTDMTGGQFSYTVTRIDRARKAESSWLAVSDHALTLFCRDLYTMEYVAVRCDPVFF